MYIDICDGKSRPKGVDIGKWGVILGGWGVDIDDPNIYYEAVKVITQVLHIDTHFESGPRADSSKVVSPLFIQIRCVN